MKNTSIRDGCFASTEEETLGQNKPECTSKHINMRTGTVCHLLVNVCVKEAHKKAKAIHVTSVGNIFQCSQQQRDNTENSENIFQHLGYITPQVNLTSGSLLPYTVLYKW